MNTSVSEACPPDSVAWLRALAIELRARSWPARVYARQGMPPHLHTRNPEPGTAALSEHIYAHARADGTWAYWWPWPDTIGDTPADAADEIIRVLRAASTP